ncbi:MAG: NAD(P)-binding domain-containing protein [Deltaproteobacteria bacterium]|nr:NAD(P)-binding domain-containing protein [Deltaproteobacteria bacterium]
MNIYETIIIGGGPAGIGAALQLKHNGVSTLLIEKNTIGGRIKLARKVENIIYHRPISGNEISKILKDIINKKKIAMKNEEVQRIVGRNQFYKVITNTNIYLAKFLVIATGLKPKIPNIDGIKDESIRRYIFFEWSQLKKSIHSPVLIIGAGEVGADSACSLKEKGFDVLLFSRAHRPNINPNLKNELRKLCIKIIKDVEYKRIWANKNSINLTYKKGSRFFTRVGKSILITIGGTPNIPKIEEGIDTSRIFFCGDVKSTNFHQAAIAFGDGVNTAMHITHLLKGGNNVKSDI